MKIDDDLALDVPYIKGYHPQVNNCWHFYTNGGAVDQMFANDEDFKNGMNRIYVVLRGYDVVILAFCLMDTHVHFVLYGTFDQCNKFIHDYIKRTSMYISAVSTSKKKLKSVRINYQPVNDSLYLKTVICYTLKNPVVAGLSFPILSYPWSSGALYFRVREGWLAREKASFRLGSARQTKALLKTHIMPDEEIRMVDGVIFPEQYVATDIVERIFKSAKAFNWFICKNREEEVEANGGEISYLTVPIQEMRQHRDEVCTSVFGGRKINSLSMQERVKLARILKSKYNCSVKQIAKLSGLIYDEVKEML